MKAKQTSSKEKAASPVVPGCLLLTACFAAFDFNGAGDGIRTRDPNLGKVVLYQLSYTRKQPPYIGVYGLDQTKIGRLNSRTAVSERLS
jgi:hypothetical protein